MSTQDIIRRLEKIEEKLGINNKILEVKEGDIIEYINKNEDTDFYKQFKVGDRFKIIDWCSRNMTFVYNISSDQRFITKNLDFTTDRFKIIKPEILEVKIGDIIEYINENETDEYYKPFKVGAKFKIDGDFGTHLIRVRHIKTGVFNFDKNNITTDRFKIVKSEILEVKRGDIIEYINENETNVMYEYFKVGERFKIIKSYANHTFALNISQERNLDFPFTYYDITTDRFKIIKPEILEVKDGDIIEHSGIELTVYYADKNICTIGNAKHNIKHTLQPNEITTDKFKLIARFK